MFSCEDTLTNLFSNDVPKSKGTSNWSMDLKWTPTRRFHLWRNSMTLTITSIQLLDVAWRYMLSALRKRSRHSTSKNDAWTRFRPASELKTLTADGRTCD